MVAVWESLGLVSSAGFTEEPGHLDCVLLRAVAGPVLGTVRFLTQWLRASQSKRSKKEEAEVASSFYKKHYMLLLYFDFWPHCVSCGKLPSSPTKGQTWAPCIGSVEP